MALRLDLINSMLATTGTAKLTGDDVTHPHYVTADSILSDVIEEFSSKELWFNTSIRTLAQDVDGRVLVPSNALSCDPYDTTLDYAIRGQYLFDMSNYTNVIGADVSCVIITELTLDDMPPIARQFIRAQARLQYYIDQDGSGAKVQLYTNAFQRKELELIALNMKNSDVNFFNGRTFASYTTRRSATTNALTRIQ